MVDDKEGLSTLPYRTIILPVRTFLCCRPMLVVSLRLRCRHKSKRAKRARRCAEKMTVELSLEQTVIGEGKIKTD